MKRLLLIAFLLLPALGGATTTSPAKLMRLQATDPGLAPLTVLDEPGLKLRQAPVVANEWKLTADEPLTGNARPQDRLIELYSGAASAPILVCRVLVRYYPKNGKWVPGFRIDEEPLLVNVGGRWQPIELVKGTPTLLVQKGNVLPNAEGFFPAITFAFSSGSFPVVGWRVLR
ncbi:MAG: hypothetical protein ACJ8J7_06580 [Sulfurifustaceae bacterium]